MSRLWRTLLLVIALALAAPAFACTTGGCMAAGPRLASVDSKRGALLDLLVGRLLNSSVHVDAVDWQVLASGSVSLGRFVDALQVSTSPSNALTTGVSLGTLLNAAATAALADQKSSLALSLQNTATALAGVSGTIRLGDLLVTDGALGNTQINVLQLLTGAVQLFNTKNVLLTPTAITVPGLDLGLGGTIAQLTLAAQVIEPPVFACGPTGTTFHTAAIRLKVGIDLVNVSLDTGLLAAIPLVNTVSLSVARLDLLIEVARADGLLGAVDALAGAMTVGVKPGVADIYLGTMSDALFFNRTRAVSAADLTPATIASLTINGGTVAVQAKGSARGQAPSTTNLAFTGPYPQTRTAYTQAGFVANLLGSLIGNLTLSLTPSLPLGLDTVVLTTLKTVFTSGLAPILSNVLAILVDPLLETLGIRLGEVDVTAGGTMKLCALSGCVYADTNHSGSQDGGETGTGQALYAKLVNPAQPAGPAIAVVPVDAGACTFTFPSAQTMTWTVVVNASPSAGVVTAAVPAGWIATHATPLTASVTVVGDMAGPKFGLFNGSKLGGQVFDDSGAGGGAANNVVRDGAEAGLAGLVVRATDASGSAVLDTATTVDTGAYTLWIPAAATTVKVTPSTNASWVAVGGKAGTTGGSYTVASNTVTFTATAGSSATGVHFAVVPTSRLETDGQQSATPGHAVFLPHAFTAGTAGQLTMSATPAAGGPGWSPTLLRDVGCDGRPDAVDTAITVAIAVTAGQRICVLVKLVVPATANFGERQSLDVAAQLALSNHTLVLDHRRGDVVTVDGADSGLRLTKTVDRSTATTGDVLVYTITYLNQGPVAVQALVVNDFTPAYTTMTSAACGADTPAALVCSVAAQPAAGARGAVRWTFTGSLASGASGSVVLRVKVD